ncbi:MAG: hypothetical protein V7K27_21975 [Nostoc sp.]
MNHIYRRGTALLCPYRVVYLPENSCNVKVSLVSAIALFRESLNIDFGDRTFKTIATRSAIAIQIRVLLFPQILLQFYLSYYSSCQNRKQKNLEQFSMAIPKIADMTIDDIRALITEVVDERLQNWWQQSKDTRSLNEILAAMDRLRWTPPPESPTTTELLRQDRDR